MAYAFAFPLLSDLMRLQQDKDRRSPDHTKQLQGPLHTLLLHSVTATSDLQQR